MDVIPAHPTFAGGSSILNIYERWYKLVEGYSGRDLTFEIDRLPAIAGLYNLFAELLDVDVRMGWLNPLGEVFNGSIILKAPLRKLKISQRTVWADHAELDSELDIWARRLEYYGKQKVNVYKHDYALKYQQDTIDPRSMGMCSIRFDLETLTRIENVALLQLILVGVQLMQEKDSDNQSYGIVLEDTEDGNLYRRIGVYSIIDPEASLYSGEYATLQGWKHSVVTII
ncbi:hypothetical protein B7463_g3270, partial [Scytalidium lignicola]